MRVTPRAVKGAAAIEYVSLIIFILMAFLVMRGYIVRGFAGRWKAAGDTFGFGRQYDPRDFGDAGEGGGSLECFFDAIHCQPHWPLTHPVMPCEPSQPINMWIGQACYDEHCDCTLPPGSASYLGECLECLVDCSEDPEKFGGPFDGDRVDARVKTFCAD